MKSDGQRTAHSGRESIDASVSSQEAAQTAVQAAASAFGVWSGMDPIDRAEILKAMPALLEHARADLIELAASEIGASHEWMHFNIDLAKDTLNHDASLAPLLADQTVVNHTNGIRSVIRRQAAGVVLSMVPWNAPITLAVRAISGPLLCGNTVVLKGSELCPQTHRFLVETLKAGLPEGVLTCVLNQADRAQEIVDDLIAHPCIRRVNFTGSTRVGREVAVAAARHLKPVVLELSGKAPLIVLADADLDAAVEAACFGAYFNHGQICMSTEWIILVEAIADPFVAKMKTRIEDLISAQQSQTQHALGRMISVEAADRVRSLIDDALSKGAKLVTGGDVKGSVMQPALLDGIGSNMRVYREETFGPLASVLRVQDAEEACSAANDSDFGLNAAVFGEDETATAALADRLQYGIVQINGPTVHDDPAMPFGGMKQSGYGRFGGQSVINEFTEQRWISTHPQAAPDTFT